SLGGNPGQPHWAAPGYLMLFPLLGRLASQWPAARVRVWLITSGGLLACVATAIAIFAPIDDLIDWRGIPPIEAQLVAGTSWIQAGKVSWALGPDVPVLCLCISPHEFAFTRDQQAFIGKDAIIVMRPRTAVDMLPRYAPYFASITPMSERHIRGKL